MRIALLLIALMTLLVAGHAEAYSLTTFLWAPSVDCSIQPDSATCTICFSDPDEGPLPVSTGGSRGTGVGVALEPGDYGGFASGGDFGPYTGVYSRPNGCTS